MLLQKQKVLECENKLTEKQKNGNGDNVCCTMEKHVDNIFLMDQYPPASLVMPNKFC